MLKRWRASPLPAWCCFAGRVIATVLLADAGAVVTVPAADLRGIHPDGAMALSLLVAATAGALAWSGLGTAGTAVIPTSDSAYPLLSASYLPVVLISGVFFSAGGEPHWLAMLAGYLPVEPVVDAVARSLTVAPGCLPAVPVHDLLVLAAWSEAGLVVSLRRFRWEPRPPGHARARQGKPGKTAT